MVGFFLISKFKIMARVQNTLIGRASGSVGAIVFYTWKSLNIMRSKADYVYNPNTLPQQSYRNKYGFAVGLYNQIRGIVDIGLKNYAIKMSLQNFFLKQNLGKSITSDASAFIILQPEQLIISKGLMLPTVISSIATNPTKTIVAINYKVRSQIGQTSNDKAHALIYCQNSNQWVIGVANANPVITNVLCTVPTALVTGEIVHAWLFFKNEVTGVVSDSYYLQKTL